MSVILHESSLIDHLFVFHQNKAFETFDSTAEILRTKLGRVM